MSKLTSILQGSFNAKGLGLFRICFSASLFFQSVYFLASDFIKNNFIDREIEFPILQKISSFPFQGKA